MSEKRDPEKIVREIKHKTRRKFSSNRKPVSSSDLRPSIIANA
jgi:hypothetical protein